MGQSIYLFWSWSYIWIPSSELMPMYRKTPYNTWEMRMQITIAIKIVFASFASKLLWTHRHGDLCEDGRHEGREADQNENDHVGHPELYFLNKKSPRWSQQHWSPKFTISSQTYLSYSKYLPKTTCSRNISKKPPVLADSQEPWFLSWRCCLCFHF